MDNKNIQVLIGHLEQEIKWIKELNILLSEEKETLAMRQFDQLEALANKKQELSIKLEDSTSQRLDLIGNPKNQSPNMTLKKIIDECEPSKAKELNKLNNELAEQLSLCRELNTINGQVIATNIHTGQQIVKVLTGTKANDVSLYTSTGNIKTPPTTDSGHHQKA